MRVALLIGLALLGFAPAADAARNRPCMELRARAADVALDYALARSSGDELATVLSATVEIEVSGCYRLGRRRAAWKYRLRVIDDDTDLELVAERGVLDVSRSGSAVHVLSARRVDPVQPGLDRVEPGVVLPDTGADQADGGS